MSASVVDTTCTPEADADARAATLLEELHHLPMRLADLRDVVVVSPGCTPYMVPAALVPTVAAQLGGPELARELEAVSYAPDVVRVVLLVGRHAAVTTLDVRAMQAGGTA